MTISYSRPYLYPKQLDAIFNDQRYSFIEASTKSGKTHGCIVWLVEQAIQGKRGQNYWWIAPVSSQAKIAYLRLKNSLRDFISQKLVKLNDTFLTIEFVFGGIIHFKSADKPDSLYGEDVYAAVIDEASRCKKDAWYAVRSTLTKTRGKIRIIGNVKGRLNWFYELARKAESGAPDMSYHKITAYDAVEAGVLDAAEIEDAKNNLPEAVFRELYEAEASESGSNPFGEDNIKACVREGLSTNVPVVFGVDVAKSIDYTVVVGLDYKCHVCYFDRFNNLPWDMTIQRILTAIDGAPALVDATGVGDPIVEALQKGSSYGSIEGFKFTRVNKQGLMQLLAVSIASQDVRIPDNPSFIYNELMTFEFEFTNFGVVYSAPTGYFDDCVMALALAIRKFQQPKSSWNFDKVNLYD